MATGWAKRFAELATGARLHHGARWAFPDQSAGARGAQSTAERLSQQFCSYRSTPNALIVTHPLDLYERYVRWCREIGVTAASYLSWEKVTSAISPTQFSMLLLTLALFVGSAHAVSPSILLTAHLTDGQGNGSRTAYLHFTLFNCGLNRPIVNGQPWVIVGTEFDAKPNPATGIISVPVIANDQILCGNVASTQWIIQEMKDANTPAGNPLNYFIILSQGAQDYSTMTPTVVTPVPPGYRFIFANPSGNQQMQIPTGASFSIFGGTLDLTNTNVLCSTCGGGPGTIPDPLVVNTVESNLDITQRIIPTEIDATTPNNNFNGMNISGPIIGQTPLVSVMGFTPDSIGPYLVPPGMAQFGAITDPITGCTIPYWNDGFGNPSVNQFVLLLNVFASYSMPNSFPVWDSAICGFDMASFPASAALIGTDANGLPIAVTSAPIPGTNGDAAFINSTGHGVDSGILGSNFVRKDAANVASASMTLDLTLSPTLVVPNGAGFSSTTGGKIGYETTNKNVEIGANGVSNRVPLLPDASVVTAGDCAIWATTPTITVGDSLQPCKPTFLNTPYTNSTNTPSTVFSLAVSALSNYSIHCHGLYQSAASGKFSFSLTGPASPSTVTWDFRQAINISSAVLTENDFNGTGTSYPGPVGTVVTAANTDMPWDLTIGFLNGANAGTLAIQARSVASDTLTIETGSYCTW